MLRAWRAGRPAARTRPMGQSYEANALCRALHRRDRDGLDSAAKLNTFDVTSLVVGSIIGADVYVATAIGAKLVGPASLLVWILAGAMAMVIALAFAYCVMTLPKVGGPSACVNDVLTVAQLSPLVLIILGGFAFVGLQSGQFVANLTPFVRGDLAAFGRALVLIFWAYAGFELSTLPTDEVNRPGRTIPRAI